MDGRYPATVHKLLTLWYPPPSIANDPEAAAEATISRLHTYNSLADNALRPCHQLDYATSGLLLVARTRDAARFASRQWEQRRVTKTYLAVVEADLTDDGQQQHSWRSQPIPTSTPAQIGTTLRRLESGYKKTKTPDPRKRVTFQGFQPVFALYQKYKGKVLLAAAAAAAINTTTTAAATPKKKKKRSNRPADVLTPEQWDHIWEPVQSALAEEAADTAMPEEEEATLQQQQQQVFCTHDWKDIERSKPRWKAAFHEATERHNHLLRESLLQKEKEQEEEHWTSFPTLFGEHNEPSDNDGEGRERERGRGRGDHPSSSSSSHNVVVYISCPLAESSDPDTFPMKVPPSVVAQYPHLQPFVGRPELDYKPSVTKCTILHAVERQGTWTTTRTCTKVALSPLTGRRHQLRVHMALLAGNGYGIVGDATYNQHTVPLSELRKNDPAARPERMSLHSHRLSLRLLVDDAASENGGDTVDLVAPDPF
jgi:23S rRNA-/tRNA-specific pseudouridylate synthase